MNFAGNMVALVTPFRNGAVDWSALEALVETQVQGGVSALVPCGTTGESATLTHEEHDQVVAGVVRMAGGRVPVMAGTGSNCTAEAIQMTRHAERAGAAGTLQVAPYYNRPTQAGLLLHFRAIADATGLPVCLYNIPGRCGVEIGLDTFVRLSEHPRILAVKDATGNLENVTRLRQETPLAVLAGDDALALAAMALGATGVVSVLSNLLPAHVTRLVALAASGQHERARQAHDELFPLMKALFLETNPIPAKTVLAAWGRIAEEFRLPLCAMAPAARTQLLAAAAPFAEAAGSRDRR
jgi:4-hydroxy-tetrahydrodipicolinate synthase